ncbi:HisA/HisF-related TIM barrel protein [Candidatus Bathycorpusculum sp.]|uniref:HisA/HisF-related TIM barrel protein n=1 Tax=Candidatus Bathycorpusculum sp. TaxID=2994959 RepID=UPI002820C27C|nr:HisA/HisF-related TIM barrel protein [Candidatus Termitimicrobium sp.]MCL2686099.1 HisA/HisF-related TIM barrel protein [Candidatus Termitimicrobium sp.]
MKVIPVIDILNGVAVHAIRGMRSEYQPLQSSLVCSTDPIRVADAFKTLGFSTLYLADLDAILMGSFGFDLYSCIGSLGLSLMVDAGVSSFEGVEGLFRQGVSKVIIGTETLLTKGFVAEAVERFGGDRVVVSLDLKNGSILGKLGVDRSIDPLQLLGEFEAMGVLEVIVLDLARVGSQEGVDTNFLTRVIDQTGLSVYVGGGVRGISDLVELNALGVEGALVATALHTDRISVEDLRQSGFL